MNFTKANLKTIIKNWDMVIEQAKTDCESCGYSTSDGRKLAAALFRVLGRGLETRKSKEYVNISGNEFCVGEWHGTEFSIYANPIEA
jgi:hypothetical protein